MIKTGSYPIPVSLRLIFVSLVFTFLSVKTSESLLLYDRLYDLTNLPSNYRNELLAKTYVVLKTSNQRAATEGVLQLAKKLSSSPYYFPSDIIFKILNYCVPVCVTKNYKAHNESVVQMKKNAVRSVLKSPFINYYVKAYLPRSQRYCRYLSGSFDLFSTSKPLLSQLNVEDIAIFITCRNDNSFAQKRSIELEHTMELYTNLKKKGLLFENSNFKWLGTDLFRDRFAYSDAQQITYNQEEITLCFVPSSTSTYSLYESFNAHPQYSLIIKNRGTDYKYGTGTTANKGKCVLKIYDRNDVWSEKKLRFDSYIENTFCSGNLLFVELLDKFIDQNHVAKNHKSHKIVIYDLSSEVPLISIDLPFNNKMNIATLKKEPFPKYELAYVDDQNIYLNYKDDPNHFPIALRYYKPYEILFANPSRPDILEQGNSLAPY